MPTLGQSHWTTFAAAASGSASNAVLGHGVKNTMSSAAGPAAYTWLKATVGHVEWRVVPDGVLCRAGLRCDMHFIPGKSIARLHQSTRERLLATKNEGAVVDQGGDLPMPPFPPRPGSPMRAESTRSNDSPGKRRSEETR